MDSMIISPLKVTTRLPCSVWLSRDMNEPHMFFCPNCQCPEFRYQGTVAMMAAGEAPMIFPIEMYCKNKTCPMTFRIEGFAW